MKLAFILAITLAALGPMLSPPTRASAHARCPGHVTDAGWCPGDRISSQLDGGVSQRELGWQAQEQATDDARWYGVPDAGARGAGIRALPPAADGG